MAYLQVPDLPRLNTIYELTGTGKSLLEALIFALTNPQYDDRLFFELRVQYMKVASSEHANNVLCTQIGFCFDIQNNICIRGFTKFGIKVA